MTKRNKQILIIRTPIKSLSSMSVGPSKKIQQALQHVYSDVRIENVSTIAELQEVVSKKPDLCFLGVKQLPLSDTNNSMMWVSDFLDENAINYTGSQSSAIALEFDKQKAKEAVTKAGLVTSAYFMGGSEADFNASSLDFPVFIKPTNLGNKEGVDSDSVAHTMASYLSKVTALKALRNSESIVEEYLSGREFSVSVMQTVGSDELITFAIEAVVKENENGDRILATVSKSADDEKIISVIDEKINQEICALAEGVFKVLGGRDYGRIDIRLDKNGVPNFLEANLIPGLAEVSYFPIANQLNRGIGYDETIQSIAEVSFSRR